MPSQERGRAGGGARTRVGYLLVKWLMYGVAYTPHPTLPYLMYGWGYGDQANAAGAWLRPEVLDALELCEAQQSCESAESCVNACIEAVSGTEP